MKVQAYLKKKMKFPEIFFEKKNSELFFVAKQITVCFFLLKEKGNCNFYLFYLCHFIGISFC